MAKVSCEPFFLVKILSIFSKVVAVHYMVYVVHLSISIGLISFILYVLMNNIMMSVTFRSIFN